MCYFYREVDDGAVREWGGDGALGILFPNGISSWDEYFLVGIIKLSQCLLYCKGGDNLTFFYFFVVEGKYHLFLSAIKALTYPLGASYQMPTGGS